MKNEKPVITNSKKFLLPSLIITLINLSLVGLLIVNSFGQTVDLSRQTPITVEVIGQNDSPLQLSFINLDMSNPSLQIINYKLQNVSPKPIRGFVVSGSGKKIRRDNSLTLVGMLQPGKDSNFDLPLERKELQENDKVAVSIDYVEFVDGTFWGADITGKSKEVKGQIEGAKFALMRLGELIRNRTPNNATELQNLLNQDPRELQIAPPIQNQPKEWNRGFQDGFKSIIFALKKRNTGGGIEGLQRNLEEIERSVN